MGSFMSVFLFSRPMLNKEVSVGLICGPVWGREVAYTLFKFLGGVWWTKGVRRFLPHARVIGLQLIGEIDSDFYQHHFGKCTTLTFSSTFFWNRKTSPPKEPYRNLGLGRGKRCTVSVPNGNVCFPARIKVFSVKCSAYVWEADELLLVVARDAGGSLGPF